MNQTELRVFKETLGVVIAVRSKLAEDSQEYWRDTIKELDDAIIELQNLIGADSKGFSKEDTEALVGRLITIIRVITDWIDFIP